MHARYVSLLSVLLPFFSALAADGQMTDLEKKQVMKKCYRDFAATTKFSLQSGESLKFVEKPVMSWAGLEGDDFSSGDVFVWELNGRAQLVACIGSIPWRGSGGGRDIFQEYHSLSAQPFKDRHMGKQKHWAPKQGVQLKSLDAKVVGRDSSKLRLAQMRKLAAQFTGYLEYRGSDEERLRVMSQPIYRFDTNKLSKSKSGVIDGAIFALVRAELGTDPEILLLLECHKNGSSLEWKYAPVRFTHGSLRMEYNGKEVWKVGQRDRSPASSFFLDNITVLSMEEVKATVEAKKPIKSNPAL